MRPTWAQAALLLGVATLLYAGSAWPCDLAAARRALEQREVARAQAGFAACVKAHRAGTERWRGLLGVAISAEMAGDAAAALDAYRAFILASAEVDGPGEPEWVARRDRARGELARLAEDVAARRGRVAIRTGALVAGVAVDGVSPRYAELAVTPVTLYLEAGPHDLLLTAPGYQPVRRRVEVVPGVRLALDVELSPYRSPHAVPPVAPRSPEAYASPEARTSPTAAPWALIGGGGAAIAVGAVLTGLNAGDADRLAELSALPGTSTNRREYDGLVADVQTRETASFVLYAVGGASALGGVLWLLLRDDAAPSQTWVAPGPGGLALFGRF